MGLLVSWMKPDMVNARTRFGRFLLVGLRLFPVVGLDSFGVDGIWDGWWVLWDAGCWMLDGERSGFWGGGVGRRNMSCSSSLQVQQALTYSWLLFQLHD